MSAYTTLDPQNSTRIGFLRTDLTASATLSYTYVPAAPHWVPNPSPPPAPEPDPEPQPDPQPDPDPERANTTIIGEPGNRREPPEPIRYFTLDYWLDRVVRSAPDTTVRFGWGQISTDPIVELDQDVTLGKLIVNSSEAYHYTGTHSLTLSATTAGGAAVLVPLGSHSISAPVVISGDTNDETRFDIFPSASLSISGNISGTTKTLVKSGAGTLTLSGTNSYSGGTQINGGLVRFDAASAVPSSGTITVDSMATAAVGYAIDQTFLGRIDAASTGTVALGANSTNNLNFASLPSVSLGSVGSYTYSGTLSPASNTFRLGGGGGTLTVSSNLTGSSNSLLVTGPGTVVLSGTNSYSDTRVESGILKFASSSAIGGSGANVHVQYGGAVAVGYGLDQTFLGRIDPLSTGAVALAANTSQNLDFSSLPAASLGSIDNYTYSGTLTPATAGYRLGGGGGTLTVSSNLTGTATPLIVAGPGTVVPTGTNTYGGGTVLNGGTLRISADSTLGATPSSAVADSIRVVDGGTLQLSSSAGSVSLNSNRGITIDSASTLDVDTNGASNTLTVPGVVTGSGSLVKSGDGTLVLTASNSYTGGTVVRAGVLQFSGSSAIGGSGRNVTVYLDGAAAAGYAMNQSFLDRITTASAGTAALGANSSSNLNFSSLSSLSLGAVGSQMYSGTLTPAGSTYRLGGGGGTLTVSSTLTDSSRGLDVDGSGTVVLTASNTYSQKTQLLGGTLSISSSANLGDGSSTNTLHFDSGTLLTTANLTLSRNATLGEFGGAIDTAANTVTYSGVLSGSGSLLKKGSGTLVLTAANTFAGYARSHAGTLRLGNSAALQSATLLHSSSGSGSVSFGALTSATFGGLEGDRNLTLANDSSQAVALSVGGTGVTIYSGVLFGGGSLTKTNQGILILSGNNTYTGGTTISGGYLQLGNGGTAGSVAGNITNNAGVVFNRSDTSTYSGVISGTGSLTKYGAGTLVLTGANTYTGGTTIGAGTLQVGNGGTSGSLTGNIVNNAALAFNRSDNLTYSGNLSGTGSLTKAGAGTLTLNNVRLASLTVSAGTAKIAPDGSSAGTSKLASLSISSGAALDLTDNDMVLDYAGTSPLSTVRSLLLTGYNNATSPWTGAGLTSSSAAAAATVSGGDDWALAYVEASTFLGLSGSTTATWGGQTIEATSLLVKYVLAGDGNLDGTIDLTDQNLVWNNFGDPGVWTDGDYNYNGTIDLGDYNIVANNFGATATYDPSPWAMVPEPAALSILVAFPLLARRRRHSESV